MYLKECYTFSLRIDLSIFKENIFESVFVESNIYGKKTIIGEVYRIPGSCAKTTVAMYETIIKQLRGVDQVFLETDQNIDLLNDSHDAGLSIIRFVLCRCYGADCDSSNANNSYDSNINR